MLNVVPSVLLFAQNKDGPKTADFGRPPSFTVDPGLPSPNIYWIFMDGMLGFKGMERLFGD
ncbi:MAG: hypothetical protein LBG90_06900, partial [Spirochaetaceae bacterium]|nr:hypothetical protein [Spirochaetaceae bacterium]